MKVKNITLSIRPREEVLSEFAEALRKARQGEKVPTHHETSFESMETLRSVLTERRMELLQVIKHRAPGSIYELAQMVQRDLKNVNEDLHLLEKLDLIGLEPVENSRQSLKPVVEFDRLHIEIAV